MKRLTKLLILLGLGLGGCFKSDLDGKVVTPKPWGPAGGSGKYHPGATHGASAPAVASSKGEPAKS